MSDRFTWAPGDFQFQPAEKLGRYTEAAFCRAYGGKWVTEKGKKVFIKDQTFGFHGTPSPATSDVPNVASDGPDAKSDTPKSTRAGMRPANEGDQKRLGYPPAWTDVQVSEDPDADLQVIGKDSKGRAQYRYSLAHSDRQAAAKFARAQAFAEAIPTILPQIEADAAKTDTAAALFLIARTGFRVGGEGDTGAEKQAYGATTLKPEHVHIQGETVVFQFTGKKGVTINKAVDDPLIAALLKPKVKNGGEKLFATDDAKVRDYLHKVAGPTFKVKDFRTWHGTSKALETISRMEPPKNEKEFETARKTVGAAVADHLGNTPAVALDAYIDPTVFQSWRAGLGGTTRAAMPTTSYDEAADRITEHYATTSYDALPGDWRELTESDDDEDDALQSKPSPSENREADAGGAASHPRAALLALKQWERKALRRLKDGKRAVCTFETDDLPPDVIRAVESLLADCRHVNAVSQVFRRARDLTPAQSYAGGSWERKHAAHTWQARRLQFEREGVDVE